LSPFDWLSPSRRPAVFAALGVVLLALSALLGALGAPLVTPAAPLGIVSFELAGSAEAAARILDSWPPPERERAALVLWIDFLYLVVYPAWLSLACLFIARRHAGFTARLGESLAWLALAAAPLDLLENLALLRLLAGPTSDAAAALARSAALPKFGLVFTASLYILGAGGALLGRRLARGGQAG
jgi:hypothetical protein